MDASFAAPSGGRSMSPRLSANKRAILTFGFALGSGVITVAGSKERRERVKAELSGDILALDWSRVFEKDYFFSIAGRRK